MEPANIFGPPGYGSPDPDTAQGRLVTLDVHPLSEEISEDYAADELNAPEVEPQEEGSGDFNATAEAYQLAADNDVDLSEVTGTGSGGRILKSDVEAFIAERDSA